MDVVAAMTLVIAACTNAPPTPTPNFLNTVEAPVQRPLNSHDSAPSTPTPQPTPTVILTPKPTIAPRLTYTTAPTDALTPAERDTLKREALRDQDPERNPQIMTLEEAGAVVPFQILTPEYLPEGYEPEEFVAVVKGPAQGGREALSQPFVVLGVNTRYFDPSGTPPSIRKGIFVEQHIFIGRPKSAGGVKIGVEDIGGFEADVWQDKTLGGD